MEISPSFISLLENLRISNTLLDDLQMLKLKVNSMDIRKISDNINPNLFNMLFQCLATNDDIQVTLTCDILDRLLLSMNPDDLYTTFEEQFISGLQHDDCKVKLLCLKMFKRAVVSNPSKEYFSQAVVLKPIVNCISDSSSAVARSAILTLIPIAKTNYQVLFAQDMVDFMNKIKMKSKTIAYRFYEMFVEMLKSDYINTDGNMRSPASSSPAPAPTVVGSSSADSEQSLSRHILAIGAQSPLSEVKVDLSAKNDPLVAMNAVEVCKCLLDVHGGYEYLERDGYISIMDQHLELYMKDLDNLLLSDILKFYSRLGELRPLTLCDPFASRTSAYIFSLALAAPCLAASPAQFPPPTSSSGSSSSRTEAAPPLCDIPLQAKAMEVVGGILSSVQGKTCIPDVIMKGFLDALTKMLAFVKSEDGNVLPIVLKLFLVQRQQDVNSSMDALLKKHYDNLKPGASSLAAYLTNSVIQPIFFERRNIILKLMAALCVFPWGRVSFYRASGWMEFIVSRGGVGGGGGGSANSGHDYKLNKFAVVKCFMDNHRAFSSKMDPVADADYPTTFNPAFIDRMNEYEARGAFYVVPEVAVDTREA